MVGRHQEAAIVQHYAAHPELIPLDRFEAANGRRVLCVLCSRLGIGITAPNPQATYPQRPRGQFSRWQLACLLAHDWPCSCGLRFPAFVNLWRHIGADRPTSWGRQGEHHFALSCELAR